MLVVTWANGLYLSLRVAERLAAEGMSCRVLDLRWLAPLPFEEVARHAGEVGPGRRRRRDAALRRRRRGRARRPRRARVPGPMRRVAALDSFIPLGDAANLVLVSEADIESAIRAIR